MNGQTWKNSKLIISVREKKIHSARGRRKWMTLREVEAKHGHEIAEEITQRKLEDPGLRETEVRQHPDVDPNRKDCILYPLDLHFSTHVPRFRKRLDFELAVSKHPEIVTPVNRRPLWLRPPKVNQIDISTIQ